MIVGGGPQQHSPLPKRGVDKVNPAEKDVYTVHTLTTVKALNFDVLWVLKGAQSANFDMWFEQTAKFVIGVHVKPSNVHSS